MYRARGYISLLLIVVLISQMLCGCANQDNTGGSTNGIIQEKVISEQFIREAKISEERLNEKYILEHLVYEKGIYEYRIDEDIISEAYIIETVISENSIDDIQAQLPEEIQDYEIDWKKVIAEFAIGTSIIIAVGIVSHFSAGSSYFVFASPAEVTRDALIGGAIGASLREVIGCIKDGKPVSKAAKKYAIEGFAEGFMWGAIASVLRVTGQNFKRLKMFKTSTGGKLSIKPDGQVYDDAGHLLGKAYYDNKEQWHLIDESTQTKRVFDRSGKEIVEKVAEAKPAVNAPGNEIAEAPTAEIADDSLPADSTLRLGTTDDAIICKTDDLGQVFMENKQLKPNMCYQVKGYTYYTDQQGRITKATFDNLRLKPTGRPRLTIRDTMTEIGRGDALIGDQRGHLIADRFDGDNTLANIVPMTANANQGEVSAIEDIWAECLNDGGSVKGSIEIIYKGSSFRPDSFEYIYDIGEGLVSKMISNLL